MKYSVKQFSDKFRTYIGDSTSDVPIKFIIESLNWAFNTLPNVPKLDKIFSKHYTFNLNADGSYKWSLNGDFRRLNDILFLNFWTSTGGELCKLDLCNRDNVEFYNKNGIISLKKKGIPCEYTLEQDDDDVYLVIDRPSDVPIIVDYMMTGYPKPVSSPEDIIEISAIAESLILSAMREVYYRETEDFAFAADIASYLDNKQVPEAIQKLNRRMGVEERTILGEQ